MAQKSWARIYYVVGIVKAKQVGSEPHASTSMLSNLVIVGGSYGRCVSNYIKAMYVEDDGNANHLESAR